VLRQGQVRDRLGREDRADGVQVLQQQGLPQRAAAPVRKHPSSTWWALLLLSRILTSNFSPRFAKVPSDVLPREDLRDGRRHRHTHDWV
jgi:hypothetical protein